MLKKIAFISAIAIATPLFAAAKIPVLTSPKKPIVVTAQNPNFSITLKSNPSTGYAWRIKSYPKPMIEPLGHKFIPSTDKKLMGAPGYEVWTFKVIYPTTYHFSVNQVTHVVMQYSRQWEKKVVPGTSFEVIAKK